MRGRPLAPLPRNDCRSGAPHKLMQGRWALDNSQSEQALRPGPSPCRLPRRRHAPRFRFGHRRRYRHPHRCQLHCCERSSPKASDPSGRAPRRWQP